MNKPRKPTLRNRKIRVRVTQRDASDRQEIIETLIDVFRAAEQECSAREVDVEIEFDANAVTPKSEPPNTVDEQLETAVSRELSAFLDFLDAQPDVNLMERAKGKNHGEPLKRCLTFLWTNGWSVAVREVFKSFLGVK